MSLFGQHYRSFLALVALLALPILLPAAPVEFERDISPILETRCLYCHGQDQQESGLRLDRRANLLRGGDSGLATIVPGKPEKSYLIEVVNHVDEEMAMPQGEEKLPKEEIDLLTQWIIEGAQWPGQMNAAVQEKSNHWSFQPIVRPEIPPTNKSGGIPTDAFLQWKLNQQGLSFSEPADPVSLIRRVSIVLTGLAPTSEDTVKFRTAFADNPEKAYSQLVEQLLASPHFGERWAQHWLDVIRWAESNGTESNMYRKNAWIYRDYVIEAFNRDKPYDEFLVEQLAGDTLEEGRATGYLVSGPHVPPATVGREPTARRQARADRMDEVLQTVGASALGLTIGCARCHNHKFDPISISDYYSMSAVFQDIEFGSRLPEYDKAHPRRVRGEALTEQIHQLRKKLAGTGSWVEDWKGHREVHFPPITTEKLRVSFMPNRIRIDELEIFGDANAKKNVALASLGTVVDSSELSDDPAFNFNRVNDGEYGNDAWLVRNAEHDEVRPWLEFTFNQPRQVDRIRISTNRDDYIETDYMLGLSPHGYFPLKIEAQTKRGTWKQVVATKQIQQRNKKSAARAQILGDLQELIDEILEVGLQPSFIARFIHPTKTYVFGRGSPENLRDEVFAAGLSELDGELDVPPDAPGWQRRQAFADWLTAPSHPLTARVAANRIWHHIFGRGIVATPSDFGAAGAKPTHPELLDWLASEFMKPSFTVVAKKPQEWSMKHLIRLMVMSRAFKQASVPRQEGMDTDPDAQLLWRFPPMRVEAEVIRDSILQASEGLDTSIGGKSYRIHNVKKRYAQWELVDNHGSQTWRRMIYQERMRRVDDQMFTAFDFPDCGQVRPKRPVSTTPLQALNLMNSDFVIEQSRYIADRAMNETKSSSKDKEGKIRASISRCFELLLCRTPSDEEEQTALELAQENDLTLVCRAIINSNEFAFLP